MTQDLEIICKRHLTEEGKDSVHLVTCCSKPSIFLCAWEGWWWYLWRKGLTVEEVLMGDCDSNPPCLLSFLFNSLSVFMRQRGSGCETA